MKKNALIISSYNYPEGDAGSVRQHVFAKMLEDLGYDVFVIGYGKYTGAQVLQHDGVRYTSMRPNTGNVALRPTLPAATS